MMLKVDRESLAIAMQLRAKIPYGAENITRVLNKYYTHFKRNI